MRILTSFGAKVGLGVVVLIGAGALTFVLADYQLSLLASALYLSVAVLSMNLLVGMSGQISIGHAAFLGVGAYTCAILASTYHWPYWLAIVAGVIAASIVGVVVSLPALRLRGLYVALTTLGIALVFPTLLQAFSSQTGGSQGMAVRVPFTAPSSVALTPQQWTYVVILVLTVASLVLVRNVKKSRMGRALAAIKDRDIVAQSFGVHVARAKIGAFALSAGLAGLAGCMFTLQNQFVSPDNFGLTQSINLFVGMAVGGQLSIVGALVGGLFLQYVPPFTQDIGVLPVLTPLVYGVILLLITLFFRTGLVGAATQAAHAIGRRRQRGVARTAGETTGSAPDSEPTHTMSLGVDPNPEPVSPVRPAPAAAGSQLHRPTQ